MIDNTINDEVMMGEGAMSAHVIDRERIDVVE